jgi:inositol-hexakisphosphate/diphosphoinositol-pentakisphosphate 1-kinase
MASTFEELSRTTSRESQTSIKLLQRTPSSLHKGRQAEAEHVAGDVDRASISMPPPASKPIPRYQRLGSHSTRAQDTDLTPIASALQDETALLPPSLQEQVAASKAVDESRPNLAASGDFSDSMATRRSDPEVETTKRMSLSSLYNIGRSAPSSVTGGSDQDGRSTPIVVFALPSKLTIPQRLATELLQPYKIYL